MSIMVVVGVIINNQNKVLITRRPTHVDHGGLWEFPGGKVEDLETPYEALVREIHEEVGLVIESAEFLTEINYQYPSKNVTLQVYQIKKFKGIAQCLENQADLRWVDLEALTTYSFPEANHTIINLLVPC
ncbi:8-oxo-dGTP diphosphatase MutT [Legionella gresilensis]|uniref:8-oxo-dGTP diphosphatase MutT n=1 Tax=Legionella gresilensis TaxID=91823 RepID=UPI001040FD07|nr:8-oxo-dGTP diphosphatase MutT [Legionella gresilensis]